MVHGPRPRDLQPSVSPGLAVRSGSGRDGTARLTLVGDLDLSTVPVLEEALEPLLVDGRTRIALDLSGVTFCDVSGLTRLLSASRAVGNLGGELVLHGPCPSLELLLELVEPSVELAPPLPG